MAGAGFRTFVDGEVLTAAQVNTYLMQQAVMVFADASARSTAIAAPSEGMVTYLTGTDVLEYYDGAAWQPILDQDVIAAKGDLIVGTADDTVQALTVGSNEQRLVADSGETTGLKYVGDTTNYAIGAKGDLLVGTAADTLTNVGVGTNGQVLTADSAETSGVKWAAAATGGAWTLIDTETYSAASTITLDDIFSSSYRHYVIIWEHDGSTAQSFNMQMRDGASTYSGANYNFQTFQSSSTTNAGVRSQNQTSATVGFFLTVGRQSNVMWMMSPNAAVETYFWSQGVGADTSTSITEPRFYGVNGNVNQTTQYTGLIFTCVAGNVTGQISVYGVTE